MKTRNLTQVSLRKVPINRRMQGFSFRVSKDEFWSSRCEFSFLFRLNFQFMSSVGAEMSQEYNETNGMWIGGLHKENLAKIHRPILQPRRTEFKEAKMRRSRWMKSMIVIDGRDYISFREWSLPLDDRPIIGGRSWCVLIARRRKCVDLIDRWIFIGRSRWVHASLTHSSRGSLKLQFKHVADSWSGGPRVHCIGAHDSSRQRFDALDAAMRPVIKTKRKLIVPLGKDYETWWVYNVDGLMRINDVLYGRLICMITIV